jgi:hypothetical protein
MLPHDQTNATIAHQINRKRSIIGGLSADSQETVGQYEFPIEAPTGVLL